MATAAYTLSMPQKEAFDYTLKSLQDAGTLIGTISGRDPTGTCAETMQQPRPRSPALRLDDLHFGLVDFARTLLREVVGGLHRGHDDSILENGLLLT